MIDYEKAEKTVIDVLQSMIRHGTLPGDKFQETKEYVMQQKLQYKCQGNFTVAILLDVNGEISAIGVSKRHAEDRHNPVAGEALALSRAVKSFVVEHVLLSRGKA